MVDDFQDKILELEQRKKEMEKQIKILRKKQKNLNGNANEIIRVDFKFKEELEKIQEKRIEKGLDDYEMSKPRITQLIRRHVNWPLIKEDLINFNQHLEKGEKQNVIIEN